jgi:hypothetical protein
VQSTVPPKDWTVIISNDAITKEILSTGASIVYAQISGEWRMLPYNNGDIHLQASLAEGKLKLNVYKSHGVVPNSPDAMNVKLVLISQK